MTNRKSYQRTVAILIHLNFIFVNGFTIKQNDWGISVLSLTEKMYETSSFVI